MLTERDLAAIRERLETYQLRNRVLDARRTAADVPALLAEIERLSMQVAEAWMALDSIAHTSGDLARHHAILPEGVLQMGRLAAQLLRDHQAPGRKRKDGA